RFATTCPQQSHGVTTVSHTWWVSGLQVPAALGAMLGAERSLAARVAERDRRRVEAERDLERLGRPQRLQRAGPAAEALNRAHLERLGRVHHERVAAADEVPVDVV